VDKSQATLSSLSFEALKRGLFEISTQSPKTYPTPTMSEADTEAQSSPSRPGLKAFLPLSEDISFSTHGRNLQGLVRTLSTTPRRSSSYRGIDHTSEDEGGRRSGEWERRRSWDDSSLEERRIPGEDAGRRFSTAALVLMTPQMRSQRLIGNSNPRYRWDRYFKTEEELKTYKKPL